MRRIVRAEALQAVVEVRQVDQRERRIARCHDVQRASAIQRVEAIVAAGPQNGNSGNGPSLAVSSSRSAAGCA